MYIVRGELIILQILFGGTLTSQFIMPLRKQEITMRADATNNILTPD